MKLMTASEIPRWVKWRIEVFDRQARAVGAIKFRDTVAENLPRFPLVTETRWSSIYTRVRA